MIIILVVCSFIIGLSAGKMLGTRRAVAHCLEQMDLLGLKMREPVGAAYAVWADTDDPEAVSSPIGSNSSISGFPVEYICAQDPNEPLEAEFCARLQVALGNTGFITFDPVPDGVPYFHIIVLPTVRDGYLSVAVASNFMYPPLNGLALSAYVSGFIVIPDGVTDESVKQIAMRVLYGTAQWMQAAEGHITQIPAGGLGNRPVLETTP
jgi:hypothetical protein